MVSDEVLVALARLQNDSSFRVFMDEVKRRREAARDTLEQVNDPWQAGRAQGEASLARELIELAAKARSLVEKRAPLNPSRF